MTMSRSFEQQTWTILAGAPGGGVSNAIDLKGVAGGGYQIPAAITNTTATFQVSADGTTYTPLRDSSNSDVTRTIAASKAYALPDELFGWRYAKLVLNGNEAADRTILLSLSS